jgi:predicted phage terminase large subunit-like protein
MAKKQYGPASLKQEMYVNSNATITVFGGAAGSGKSYMGLMDLLKWVHMPSFRGVVFRRTTPQLKGVGGMWDTAQEMYTELFPKLQVASKDSKITFPSKAQIMMKHMEHIKDKFNIQGWQISEALVDEACQFEEEQIMYILSRLRNTTEKDFKSHLKMTCNPDYDSFLRVWLEKAQYLDKEGFPIEERCGKLVYCGQVSGGMEFEQTLEDWKEKYPKSTPLTFCFINATCKDNPILLEMEPDYLSKLENLPRVECDRLLHGNWYAREEASGYWKREWCGDSISLYQIPQGLRTVRSWDMAATLPSEIYPDPDFTVGIKGCVDGEGTVYIMDVKRFRERPAGVIDKVLGSGLTDGQDCTITIPKDPGAAGKAAADNVTSKCFEAGFTCRQKQTKTGKDKRFEPVAALAENGMIKIVKGDWNKIFHDELEAFGSGRGHDDIVDAIADLVHELCQRKAIPSFSCPDGLLQTNPFNK